MTTIVRRRQREPGEVDERYVLLRFSDGLIVDPRRCPIGIMAKGHWSPIDGPFIPGEPNAECACPASVEQVA